MQVRMLLLWPPAPVLSFCPQATCTLSAVCHHTLQEKHDRTEYLKSEQPGKASNSCKNEHNVNHGPSFTTGCLRIRWALSCYRELWRWGQLCGQFSPTSLQSSQLSVFSQFSAPRASEKGEGREEPPGANPAASWGNVLAAPPTWHPYRAMSRAGISFYRDSFVLPTSCAGFRSPPVLPWQQFLLKYRWEYKLILNKVNWRRGWKSSHKASGATQMFLSKVSSKVSKANSPSLKSQPPHNKEVIWTVSGGGWVRGMSSPLPSPLSVSHIFAQTSNMMLNTLLWAGSTGEWALETAQLAGQGVCGQCRFDTAAGYQLERPIGPPLGCGPNSALSNSLKIWRLFMYKYSVCMHICMCVYVSVYICVAWEINKRK